MRGYKTRISVIGKLLIFFVCLMFFSIPQFPDFSVNIVSWGPIDLTFNLGAKGSTFLGAAIIITDIVISYLVDDPKGSAVYYAIYEGGKAIGEIIDQVKTKIVVKIDANDPIKRSVLRIKFREIIQNDRIMLNHGAYLKVEDDGRMVFKNISFKGYMMIHYSRTLSIWNENNILIMGIQLIDNRLYFVQRKSMDCSPLIRLLFGSSYGEDSSAESICKKKIYK